MLYQHQDFPSVSAQEPLHQAPGGDPLPTECSHILVPTELSDGEAPAITMGWELAVARRARLTLMYVISLPSAPPPEEPPTGSVHWLEGIERLHASLNDLSLQRVAMLRAIQARIQTAREQLSEFCERQIPPRIRLEADVQLEVCTGDCACEVKNFVAAKSVDLLILTSKLSWWRLPLVPSKTHRLLKGLNTRYIVVSPDATYGRAKRNGQTSAIADRRLA